MAPAPQVEIYGHAPPPPGFALEPVASRGEAAVRAALAEPGPHPSDLPRLETVEVNLVDDRTIARVHEEYTGVPGATDVVTFQHGEIFISLETAAARAAELGVPVGREVMLYLVHGLLHLNGHEDAVPAERAAMARVQERILEALWPAR